MKKKRMLLAAFFAANILMGQTAFAEEEETQEEVAVEIAETEEPAAAEAVTAEAGEAPVKTEAAAMGAEAGMANPMLEYPDVPSLERSVGFPVYYLPGNMLALYHPAQHIYSIDRYISDIRFKSAADDSKITVRTALVERVGTEDISGYYGEWTKQSAGDVKRTQVYVAQTASGIRVVRWTAGRFAFAITLEGVDDATFRNMLKNFVSVADRFAHKYRNFRLNYKKPKAEEKPVEEKPAEEKPAEEKPAEETAQPANETPAAQTPDAAPTA